MIEFDDAGNGCPIGGESFVARRVETDEHFFAEIPSDRHRFADAKQALIQLLAQIKPLEGEEIVLCTGQVFNGFASHLKEKGHLAKRSKVSDRTNDLAEAHFEKSLREMGLPESIALEGRNYGDFYEQILIWSRAFHPGGKLLKTDFRIKPSKDRRRYMINSVYQCPNLLDRLFEGTP